MRSWNAGSTRDVLVPALLSLLAVLATAQQSKLKQRGNLLLFFLFLRRRGVIVSGAKETFRHVTMFAASAGRCLVAVVWG